MDIELLRNIVTEAAALMMVDSFDVTQKGGFENIVTSADMAVQNFLRERLSEELPGSGFICEENDIRDTRHADVWIIDPIDGTANFARGLGQCAICVGLKRDADMELAVVYLPRTDEMFSAQRSKGAWLNGRPLRVSDRPFANGIMFTALPVYHKEYADLCSGIIRETFAQCNDIRRLGACAPELCYIAAGRAELYFEYMLGPWDFAAASLILSEAGGCLCALDGDALDVTRSGGVLAANSPESLARLQSIVMKHIRK